MPSTKMVAPKHIAIGLDNRDEIMNAFIEANRLQPNKESVELLIDTFNKVHNSNIFTLRDYNMCDTCRMNLRKFWKYVIKEWKKQ